MSYKKFILPLVGAVSLFASIIPFQPAHAVDQEIGSLSYYPVTESEYRDNYVEWMNFFEYNGHRERCQHYREPPAGFYMIGCDIYRVETKQQAAAQITRTEETVVEAPAPAQKQLMPIVSSYTIYFGFDKSNVRESEQVTLQRVADEIKTYKPMQVTVAGHTDTSGPAKYNDMLSQRRAQAVAKALSARGINNEVIDKKAYGEEDLAVPTKDGVKKEENRRVVIDFRRQD